MGNGDPDSSTWSPLKNWNEDLKDKAGLESGNTQRDIVEVWSYPNNMYGGTFTKQDRKLLWSRNIKEVKLNREYTAKVDTGNKTVTVGCQVFPFEKIDELREMMYKKD